MLKYSLLAGLMMLAGCSEAPADKIQPVETQQQAPEDPNVPDSYGVAKICADGTKVYLLSGGVASGQYAIWSDQWELLASGVTPESVCTDK